MEFNFKEKWGPLPIWAWGAIAGGAGLLVVFIYNRSKSKSSAETVTSGNGSGSSNFDAGLGYQTSGHNGAVSDATPQVTATDTNQKWITRAAQAIADQLSLSVSSVSATLSRYAAQGYGVLAPREQKVVDAAITAYGQPPQATSYSGSDTAPFRVVRDTDDTNGGLFKLYQDGTVEWISGAEWTDLQALGYKITGSQLIKRNDPNNITQYAANHDFSYDGG